MSKFLSYQDFINEARMFRRINRSRIDSKTSTDKDDSVIIDYIHLWIDQNTPPFKSNKIADFLLSNRDKIKELSITNPEIYQSPIGEVCYRGLEKVSDMKQVIESIKKNKFEITVSPGYDGLIRALKIDQYKYSPRRSAQSWSIDPDVPWRFSNSGIILETKIDSDFIMNPEYTSNLNKTINKTGAAEGLSEEEVIHLGNSYKNPVSLYIDLGNIEDGDELYPYLKDVI